MRGRPAAISAFSKRADDALDAELAFHALETISS